MPYIHCFEMLTYLVMCKMAVLKIVCLCQGQQASAIYSLCLSHTFVSVKDNMCLSQTVCVCYRQSLSVTDICFCHRQSMSVTDSCCLSHKIFVSHIQLLSIRECMCVTDSICLSQTVCEFSRHFLLSQPVCIYHR